MTTADWDVLVVGRSYAGLSAALNLGRTRRSVLLVGRGGPRNDAVLHTHGMITQDGAAPADILAAAEKELAKYPTVEIADERVTGLAGIDKGFRASLGKRTTSAQTVILATGVNDNPPAIPGLADHWGRGVFTCPFCDGFEHADRPLAVTGAPAHAAHMARLLRNWSEQVTVFVEGLDPAERADLGAHGVRVEDLPITRVVGDGTRVTSLTLADGIDVPAAALFVAQLPVPNNQLAVELGCSVDDNGFVRVDDAKRTTVPGVWAIGDVITMRANMALAIADGVLAAVDVFLALHPARP